MREFEQEILELINRWEVGDSSNAEVFEKAESLVENHRGDQYFPHIPFEKTVNGFQKLLRSNEEVWNLIPAEIVGKLESMHNAWPTRKDIPAMKRLISGKIGDAINEWRIWEKYWTDLDMEQRRKEVSQMGWPYMFFEERDKEFVKKFQR